jgi:hypothetical protein
MSIARQNELTSLTASIAAQPALALSLLLLGLLTVPG